jgi:hypothetical protein
MRRAVAIVLLTLAFPATAHARRDPLPWATVNVCDSAKQPDAIGIRASMPGSPKGAKLSMRFRVQYRDGTDWKDVDGADSGWVAVGLGNVKGTPVEYGWSFTFQHATDPVTVRGVVKFRWRKGDTLPKQSEVATEAGHKSSAGADPAGYSAATCALGS